jgi:hypothetical protein
MRELKYRINKRGEGREKFDIISLFLFYMFFFLFKSLAQQEK